MDEESQPIIIDSQNSDEDDRKTSSQNEDSGNDPETPGHLLPRTPDKDDSDILIIDEDSPELSKKLDKALDISQTTTTSSPVKVCDQQTSGEKEGNAQVLTKSASDGSLSEAGQTSTLHDHSARGQNQESGNKSNVSETDQQISTGQTVDDVSNTAETGSEMLIGANGQTLQRSTSAPVDESNLNQAALTLLKRLEFKNPGRKQMDYGNFNPEESEREKKKLRRFQTSKPRPGVCYKEDGTLFDGRNICDCLTEECPGCFYTCPQCESQKCGPTCRINRKWVYDYIEDEGRNYRVEFPEAEMNFGM